MNSKLKYLLLSTKKWILRQGFSCPSCGHNGSVHISPKYLVTSLRRCLRCNLLFRTPTMTSEENDAFYQDEYQEGFTTEMPNPKELVELKRSSFAGSPKDFRDRVRVLEALNITKGARLCDFGCSWGYGSWQFSQNGFRVQAFEISVPRAEFARSQLDVDVASNINDLTGPFDVFFSSHVLEHVPSVQEVLDLAFRLLHPGGYFLAFTPNGSITYRQKNRRSWQLAWGLKHPNHLDDLFYRKAFASRRYHISSSPYSHEELTQWSREPIQHVGNLHGAELMVIVQKGMTEQDAPPDCFSAALHSGR